MTLWTRRPTCRKTLQTPRWGGAKQALLCCCSCRSGVPHSQDMSLRVLLKSAGTPDMGSSLPFTRERWTRRQRRKENREEKEAETQGDGERSKVSEASGKRDRWRNGELRKRETDGEVGRRDTEMESKIEKKIREESDWQHRGEGGGMGRAWGRCPVPPCSSGHSGRHRSP